MSAVKTSNDLFLGKQELDRIIQCLWTDGAVRNLQFQTHSFGIVKFILDTTLSYFKVEAGTNPGTVKVPLSYAIDFYGRTIVKAAQDNIAIPNDNTWYWMKIIYETNPEEVGSVSIDTAGNLTSPGGDTKFQQVLRGAPNHPAVIKFTDSVLNTSEYEVVEVTSDTVAILAGVFANETPLKYKVIGTFTPGVQPSAGEKDIFQYDSCKAFTVAAGGLVQSDPQPGYTPNFEFFCARVKNNGGVVIIEDKRTEFFYLRADQLLSYIDRTKNNPILAVESVKWDNEFSTRDKNQIIVGWGLRSVNWTVSTSLRQVTFSGGEGGILKSGTLTQGFTDNDFNGWRLYFKNGKYSKVLTSLIDGTNIKITVDVLNPDDYTSGDELVVVPDVEEVEIKVTSDSVHRVIEQIESQISFNVRSGFGKIWQLIPVSNEDESTSDSISVLNSYFFNLQYRYKVFGDYTEWKEFPDANISGLTGTGYYDESSYDEYGVLKTNPGDRTRKTYSGSISIGFVECVPSTFSYWNRINALDIGDLKGVQHTTINASTSLIDLQIGLKRQCQVIDLDGFTLTQNIWVNLNKLDGRNGNSFIIQFETGLLAYAGQTLKIVTDYVVGGGPPTVVLLDITSDINDTIINKGKFAVLCTYDGVDWVLKDLSEYQATELMMGIAMKASSAEAIACVNSTKMLTPLELDEVGFKALINGTITTSPGALTITSDAGVVTVVSAYIKFTKLSNKLVFIQIYAHVTTATIGPRFYIDLTGSGIVLSSFEANGSGIVYNGAYTLTPVSTFKSLGNGITFLKTGGAVFADDTYYLGGQFIAYIN